MEKDRKPGQNGKNRYITPFNEEARETYDRIFRKKKRPRAKRLTKNRQRANH